MDILINAVVSVVVGIGLWLLLPRGVVLVYEDRHYGEWTIRNDSPLPVQLCEVTVRGVNVIDEATGQLTSVSLLPGENDYGAYMALDDEVAEIGRDEQQRPWREIVLVPGETITASVNLNTSLSIKYRRAGWSGVLERRMLTIHGGV